MALNIENNIEILVGQFSDGSRGDHVVSVIDIVGIGSFPHAVRRDDVLTGELHELGFGATRGAAFHAAYGDSITGREMYDVWKDQHRDAAISLVADTVDRLGPEGERIAQKVILEGPPIYLFPDPEPGYEMEDIGSASSIEGWNTLDHLAETISHVSQEHFVMIDDFNGRPEGTLYVDPEVSLDLLTQGARLSDLSILQPSGIQRTFLESTFTDQDDESRNKCSFLDAKFQMAKINSLLKDYMTPQQAATALREALFVVVHPTVFAGQQEMMLEAILGEMKDHPQLKVLSKQERMDLIGRLYIHVWVDNHGDVAGVTQPMWNKDQGRFEHMDVGEAQEIRAVEDEARRVKEEEVRLRREAYANRL